MAQQARGVGKRMGKKVSTKLKADVNGLKPTTSQAMSVQRTGPRLPRDDDFTSLIPFSRKR